ncbi:MAG: MATE family efflux transporter [Firmicutes bacterium]|nr:MATE family efflux transporter [Bacillota bacterium]
MSSYEKNLTEGNVSKQLLGFAAPFFAGQVLQAAYSVADMLIAGHFMGDYGISAINSSSVCIMLITMLVNGFSLSGTVLVAQYTGAKMKGEAKSAIGTLFTVFIYCSLVITILGLAASNTILTTLNVPSPAVGEAKNYLRICFLGTIFICGYNAVSAVLRGLGDSRRPLCFVAFATVLNIILDTLFIGLFKWGAGGAALATITAQAFSFALAIKTLYKNNFVFDFKPKSFKIDRSKLKLILKIGLPSAMQSTIVNFSMLFVVSTLNSYGLAASTAAGIGNKIDSFAVLPTIAIGQSVAAMSGQNLGAGRLNRVRSTVFCGLKLSLLFGILMFVFVNLFGQNIVSLFNCSDATKANALMYIKYVTVSYMANSIVFTINGLAQGSGNSLFSLCSAFTSVVIARIPLIFLFETVLGMGLKGVFIAMGLGQYGGIIIVTAFYLSGKWKRSIVNPQKQNPTHNP